MSDAISSPRRQLLLAMGKTLQLISTENGYLTDAGAGWTLEPAPGDQDTLAVLTAVIEKQQRAETPSKVNTHRLTTVSVIAVSYTHLTLPTTPYV